MASNFGAILHLRELPFVYITEMSVFLAILEKIQSQLKKCLLHTVRFMVVNKFGI